MPEAMDALKSFAHLTDTIPQWLVKLDELAMQVAEQHSRFARISPSQFTEFRLSKKHDSTETLRPADDDRDHPSSSARPDPVAPSKKIPPSSQPGATPLAKEINRKRKPGTAELSAGSGPQRYRTRSLVIVYYDSAIQEAFEQFVRSIAVARNNLRKARTAASFKARIASMGMGDDDGEAYPALNPKLMIKRASRVSPLTVSPSFQKADEDLDAAQNLCEVAAHQFLRDGDCGEEIAGTRKRFEECLETAQAEVEKLQVEEANKSEVDPTEQAPEVPEKPVTISTEKIGGPRIPTIPTVPATGTIEVDDDSDAGSVHLDLTAFRRARRV
ncbi:MAG: hypothetical protein Q9211_003021 [Gyalolechia sp. 1 TL-2023]